MIDSDCQALKASKRNKKLKYEYAVNEADVIWTLARTRFVETTQDLNSGRVVSDSSLPREFEGKGK